MTSTAEQPRTDKVSEIYAQALLELADQQQQTEAMTNELQELRDLLAQHPELQQLMESHTIRPEARAKMLERLFKGHISDPLYHFIQVLNRKNRLEAFPRICTAFNELIDQRGNFIGITAYSASDLDTQAADHIKEVVSSAYSDYRVHLTHVTDPDIIGGLKLRVGDTLIDGSVATQLKLIRRNLIKAGRAKAREVAAQHRADPNS